MLRKTVVSMLGLLVTVTALTSTGCIGISSGPTLGIFGIPIPVSPYVQKHKEDVAYVKERYSRVPILPPLTAGAPAVALDPPSDDEVMRAFEKARPHEGGIPLLHEVQRNNIRIITEKIADYVDPVRIIPHIGPVQLHHAHYKCTIFFSERTLVGWPIPHQIDNEDAVEVVYIDHNHFHMVGNIDPGPGSNY